MKTSYSILIFLFTLLLMVEIYQFGLGSSFSNPGLASAVPVNVNITYRDPGVTSTGSFGNTAALCPNQLKASGPIALPPSVCTAVGSIAGDPLAVAIVVGLAFTALGLLAGTLGAGILASKVANVGLAIGFIAGINAGINNNFSGIPTVLWILINGVLAIFMVILIQDALSGATLG